MSAGALCLRCQKYLAAPASRTTDHCVCVSPVPSVDGKGPVGCPPGFDWRRAEYAAALGARHASWCPHVASPAFGCFCDYGLRPELPDPRPEVVEEAVAKARAREGVRS